MPTLNNRSHPAVARLRAAREGRDGRSIFVEGRRLIAELLATPLSPRELALTPLAGADPRSAGLVEKILARGATVHYMTPSLMEHVSDLDSPPGLALRADKPKTLDPNQLESIPGALPLIAMVDGVQSPSNLGAILRVAEASGVNAVGLLPGTADPFSPKSLRGSAGSAFRVPIFFVGSIQEFHSRFKRPPTYLVADARAPLSYTDWDWRTFSVLVLGGEARGVTSKTLSDLPVHPVSVPMSGKVESLNVAVAAGIVLMEARRQRKTPSPESAQHPPT